MGRGVRQGCPLSGILFTIGIEILANAIRSKNEIKGIEIDDVNTIKLTQYADDTTAFLRDVQSLNNLFSLLAQFESCSGLRINQSKSELLWLGSLRHRKDTLLNLRLSEEPIYALGVHFSYDEQLAAKKYFFDRLDPLRRILNIWSSRDISIYGRINVVKTIAISKLTFVCSVLNTPDKFTNKVNKLIFDSTGFFCRSQVTGHRSQVTGQLSLEIHQQRQFKQLLRPFSFSTTSSRLIQTVWQASHMAIEGNVLLLISTFITVPMSIFTIISVLALEFLLSTFSECLFNCFAM